MIRNLLLLTGKKLGNNLLNDLTVSGDGIHIVDIRDDDIKNDEKCEKYKGVFEKRTVIPGTMILNQTTDSSTGYIGYNPDYKDFSEYKDIPSQIILVHELIHTYHIQTKRVATGYTEGVHNEELRTVGLRQFEEGGREEVKDYTENKFRDLYGIDRQKKLSMGTGSFR